MASITINGRQLQVLAGDAPGGLGRAKRAALAEKALRDCQLEEVMDRVADMVLAYVGQNEGVTREWLLENLPADCSSILRECFAASWPKVSTP